MSVRSEVEAILCQHRGILFGTLPADLCLFLLSENTLQWVHFYLRAPEACIPQNTEQDAMIWEQENAAVCTVSGTHSHNSENFSSAVLFNAFANYYDLFSCNLKEF